MSLTKFEKLRQQAEEEMKEKLAKIEEEEKKEREKRIAPLVSKYVNLMEEVATKVVTSRVEEVDKVKFKKTDVRKRLLSAMEEELNVLIEESKEEEKKNSIEGMDPGIEDSKNSNLEAGEPQDDQK